MQAVRAVRAVQAQQRRLALQTRCRSAACAPTEAQCRAVTCSVARHAAHTSMSGAFSRTSAPAAAGRLDRAQALQWHSHLPHQALHRPHRCQRTSCRRAQPQVQLVAGRHLKPQPQVQLAAGRHLKPQPQVQLAAGRPSVRKVAAPFFLSAAALNSVCARRSNGEAEELSVSIVSVSNRGAAYIIPSCKLQVSTWLLCGRSCRRCASTRA